MVSHSKVFNKSRVDYLPCFWIIATCFIYLHMPKNQKLTETQLLEKLQKIAKNAENDISYKYGGIAFFLDHLHKKGINAFDILQKAYNDAS